VVDLKEPNKKFSNNGVDPEITKEFYSTPTHTPVHQFTILMFYCLWEKNLLFFVLIQLEMFIKKNMYWKKWEKIEK